MTRQIALHVALLGVIWNTWALTTDLSTPWIIFHAIALGACAHQVTHTQPRQRVTILTTPPPAQELARLIVRGARGEMTPDAIAATLTEMGETTISATYEDRTRA